MKKYILLIFISFAISSVYSQCVLLAQIGENPLNCGDTTSITLIGSNDSLSFNDFNSGNNWPPVGSPEINSSCVPQLIPPSPDGTDYLWMGNLADVPRGTTSPNLDTNLGGEVCFDLIYAQQGGNCNNAEGPDLCDEGVTFQYSIDNGATWIDIAYFQPDGTILTSNPGPGCTGGGAAGATPFTAWGNYCFPIPAGAETTSTQFQWAQEDASSTNNDHWGLDNIFILTDFSAYGTFVNGSNFVPGNVLPITASGDSTFSFIATNGTDSCFTTLEFITNPTDAGPDIQVACAGLGSQLNVTGVSASASVTWTPGPTLDDPNSQSPFANPIVDTQYFVTSDCGTDSVTVFVEDVFVLDIPQPDTICLNGTAAIDLSTTPANIPIASIDWSNATTLSSPTGPSVIAEPTVTTTYIATVESDSGCVIQDSITVFVQGAAKEVQINNGDTVICPGDSINLFADVVAEYIVSPAPFLPLNLVPGSGTQVTFTAQDNVQGPFQIGFPFEFYGTTYTEYWISSNGWISFTDPAGNSDWSNDPIGSTNGVNNIIAYAWDDLSGTNGAPTTEFFLTGTPPNQQLVIQLTGIQYFGGSPETITLQVILSADGSIQFNNIDIQSNGTFGSMTQGIENSTGSLGIAVPGHNNSNWNSQGESWIFSIPQVPASAVFTWSPTATLTTANGQATTAFPSNLTTYTVVLEDGFCVSTDSIQVSVSPITINATDQVVLCAPGDTAELSYALGNVPAGACIEDYTLEQVPFSLEVGSGTLLNFSSNDDGQTGAIPFPFQFDFFCQTVDNIIVNSNGLVNMVDNGGDNNSRFTDVIPDPTGPQAYVAFFWDDMFNSPATSSYFVTGTAPNRKFVVDFTLVHWPASGGIPAIGQVVFHETTNIIDISCENCEEDASFASATQGIENYDGTYGIPVPGRNNSAWSATNETWRFTPINSTVNFTTIWSPNSNILDVNADTALVTPPITTDYLVEVISSDYNCSFFDTTEVLVAVPIEISPDVTICGGDSTQLGVSFADEYLWFPNNGSISNSLIQNPVVAPSSTTEYIVTTDFANCIQTDSVTVTVNPEPIAIINGGDTTVSICDGLSTDLTTDADPAWDILWVGPETGTEPNLTVSTMGVYNIVTENDLGCASLSSIEVFVNTPIAIESDSIRNVLCCNDDVTIDFNDLVINGVAIQEVYWDGNTVASNGTETVNSFEDGSYFMNIVDVNGCETTAEVFFTTSCNEYELVDSATLVVGGSIDYAIPGATGVTEYVWSPIEAFTGNIFTSDGSVVDDFQDITAEINTTFVLNNGEDFTCTETDDTRVFIVPITDPEFPDAFTPNGDGVNDIFFPVNLDANSSISSFHVYNRWGEKVYDYSNDSNGWDGTYLDQLQPSDVYNYYIVVDKTIDTYIISGTLTLIR